MNPASIILCPDFVRRNNSKIHQTTSFNVMVAGNTSAKTSNQNIYAYNAERQNNAIRRDSNIMRKATLFCEKIGIPCFYSGSGCFVPQYSYAVRRTTWLGQSAARRDTSACNGMGFRFSPFNSYAVFGIETQLDLFSFSVQKGESKTQTAISSSCKNNVGKGFASRSYIYGTSTPPTLNPYHPENDDDEEDWSNDKPAPDEEESILDVKK